MGPSEHAGLAASLASLPGMGPARLAALVAAHGFAGAWDQVRSGRVPTADAVLRTLGTSPEQLVATWRDAARALDPAEVFAAHRRAGIDVVPLGTDRYPSALAADLEPPAVVFARGDVSTIPGRRVAVIGTRRCTGTGRVTANELGRGLADAGVRVVSGLALGIDGAAHQGALASESATPVIGVVGTGLDVVYPPRHRALWSEVADRGVLLSEAPLGTAPSSWRFPARNRIIAALAEVVVVVESHERGGALLTAEEALRRDRPVLAVPGSVRASASAGTNTLLHEGCGPARDTTDVLTALGFESSSTPSAPRSTPAPADDLEPGDADLLELLAGGPLTLDALASASHRDLGDLAVTLLRFEQRGWVERSGGWIERVRR